MDFYSYLICILGMGLVTYIPRWLPLALLPQREIPEMAREWLGFIPACILSALVAPAVFLGSSGEVQAFNAKILAAVPTLIFALKTRSLGGTVLVGMVLYWILNMLI